MEKEINIDELQEVITKNWKSEHSMLSDWIDIVKTNFPNAEVLPYLYSESGRINGVLYEFKEKKMYRNSPKIIKGAERGRLY